MNNIWESFIHFFASDKFYIPVFTIAISILLIKLFDAIIKKKLIKKNTSSIDAKRRNTIFSLISNILKYIVIILAVIVILSVYGFNVTGLITGLGVAGVVAGLALQDALKDIIMGCNIILDNYYVVGDYVEYKGFTGEVVEFGLKNTKIRGFDGEVLVVSNRQISEITNLSQKNNNYIITMPFAYEEKEADIKKLFDVCFKEIKKLKDTTGDPEYLGIKEFGESSIVYMIKVHTTSQNQFAYKRAIYSIIKKNVDELGIKIPYPQIEVHNGKRI